MTISVIINTINRDQEVARCLESLKRQTDKDFEVIIVDQSKNRRTKTVCRPYNLKYYRLRKRKNLAHSRNFGVNMAAGKIVAFIDDDAEAAADWVEQIKLAYALEKPSMIAGKVIDMRDVDNPAIQYQNGTVTAYGEAEPIHPENESVNNRGRFLAPLGTDAVFLRKEIIRLKGFDEFYDFIHETTDFAVRLIKARGLVRYSNKLNVAHFPFKAYDRKGNQRVNWRVFSKNSVYFGLKNGVAFMPLRILRTLFGVFSAKGPYRAILGKFLQRRMTIFGLLKNWFFINLGATQGLHAGVFRKRQLVRKFETNNHFVLFTRRP